MDSLLRTHRGMYIELQGVRHELVRRLQLCHDKHCNGWLRYGKWLDCHVPFACRRVCLHHFLFLIGCELHFALHICGRLQVQATVQEQRVQVLHDDDCGFHGLHHAGTHFPMQLRSGACLPQLCFPSGFVHHHHRTLQRRCCQMASCNVGGVGSLHVLRRFVGVYKRWHQEHSWRNVAEGCEERISPNTPPECSLADENRRLQCSNVQACNPVGLHRLVPFPCRYLCLYDDCGRHRLHQFDDDNAKLPWQRGTYVRFRDWSDDVVERTARLCQMD